MDYSHLVDGERLESFTKLVKTIKDNLPTGFEEIEDNNGISFVVPHSLYPKGYHVTREKPLPFISVIAQKKHIGLYHMGVYADAYLLTWFKESYAQQVPTKLNMGKSCIRFTNVKHIPYTLIGQLASKMSPEKWIELYDVTLQNNSN